MTHVTVFVKADVTVCTAATRELICDRADVTLVCTYIICLYTHAMPCSGSQETATGFLHTSSDSSDFTYFFITEIAAIGFLCGSYCSDMLLTWLIFSLQYHVCLKCLLRFTFMNHAGDLLLSPL